MVKWSLYGEWLDCQALEREWYGLEGIERSGSAP
jgi:hypothetical protein